MYKLPLILAFILIGCQPKEPTPSNLLVNILQSHSVGWDHVCEKVPPHVGKAIFDSLAAPYFNRGADYNYFSLHILKPLTDGQRPVILETTLEGESWVRMFTFRASHLVFVTESSGSVFGIESDSLSGVIRLLVQTSQPNDTSTIVLEELRSSTKGGLLHYSVTQQYVLTKSSVARLTRGRGL